METLKPYTDLKKCPFCGKKLAKLEESHYDPGFVVRCSECFAITKIADTETEAVDFWNDEIFTDVTVRLSKPHEIHVDGALALTEKILSDEVEVYQAMYAVIESNHFKNRDQEMIKARLDLMENFFTHHPVIAGIPVDGKDAFQSVRRKAKRIVEERRKKGDPIATKEEIKLIKREMGWTGQRRREGRRDFWKKTREA